MLIINESKIVSKCSQKEFYYYLVFAVFKLVGVWRVKCNFKGSMKSCFVIRVETGNNNDIKIFLTNNQIINVELGRDYKASSIINEILDFSAEGSDYNVYNISSFSEK